MKFKFERILQVLIKYVYKLFYRPKLISIVDLLSTYNKRYIFKWISYISLKIRTVSTIDFLFQSKD